MTVKDCGAESGVAIGGVELPILVLSLVFFVFIVFDVLIANIGFSRSIGRFTLFSSAPGVSTLSPHLSTSFSTGTGERVFPFLASVDSKLFLEMRESWRFSSACKELLCLLSRSDIVLTLFVGDNASRASVGSAFRPSFGGEKRRHQSKNSQYDRSNGVNT